MDTHLEITLMVLQHAESTHVGLWMCFSLIILISLGYALRPTFSEYLGQSSVTIRGLLLLILTLLLASNFLFVFNSIQTYNQAVAELAHVAARYSIKSIQASLVLALHLLLDLLTIVITYNRLFLVRDKPAN